MKTLTRRNVITTMSASTVMLCPAILNAHDGEDFTWGNVPDDVPPVPDRILALTDRNEAVDITGLAPGQVAVVSIDNPAADYLNTGGKQYVAILRRTEAQIAAGAENDQQDQQQDDRFFVADLSCPHRGYAVGITGDPKQPFACTKEGSRHHSIFDGSGKGIHGKSTGEYMKVPAHGLDIVELDGAISKAVFQLA